MTPATADKQELPDPDAWHHALETVEEGKDYTRTVVDAEGNEVDVTVTVTEISRHEDGSLAGISYTYDTP